MIKSFKTLLYAIAIYISVAGLITFSLFICEEAFQTVMFGTWPAKQVQQWHLVKSGSDLMERINHKSKIINTWFGWIQPVAYVAYNAYIESADYYIKSIRSEAFANEPGLFLGEQVSFEFTPLEITFADDGRFLAVNKKVGVLTSDDIKLEKLLVSGPLVRYKRYLVVELPAIKKLSQRDDDDGKSEDPGRHTKTIYTASR